MKRLFEAKPVLDEREMQEMYRIDHAALWATVSLLCAAVIVQLLLGADFAQMAGELVVLCVAAVGMFIAYARRGIWDESSRPSLAGNAVCAAVSAVGVALVTLLVGKRVLRAALAGVVTFILCFLLLTLLMRYVKRRQEKQGEALEDEE